MTAESLPSTWIVKAGDANSAEFTVCLEGPLDHFAAIHEGDWLIVTTDGNSVLHVGSVMRLRSDLQSTVLYLDRKHVASSSVKLAEVGVTPATGSATRLSWDDFVRILPQLGASAPNAIPFVQDVSYVRDLLELAVRDDLLGPACGPNELIKDMSVRDRYLLGKLAPRCPGDMVATRVEPAAAADEAPDLEDERPAPRHEPGAEFPTASGRVEPEDEALDEIDTTNNQSLVPSSIGMTFCVASGVDELSVEARWGRYERVPSEEHDVVKRRKNRETGREEEVRVKVWRRIPCGGAVSVPLVDGPVKPSAPDKDQPEVRLQGTVRTNGNGDRLVTLFLVNGQLELEDNKDRAWLFQPEIIAKAASGTKSVFKRRPSNELVVDDPERDRLGLIYRNRLEFAVGHGVSVHAEPTAGDPTTATLVRTEIMPRYEVGVTETPGLDPRDRPEMRRLVDQGWLDMSKLAELPPDALKAALSCLIDDYAVWIGQQSKRLGSEIKDFDAPGKDVIARCEETLRRLREGMQTLLADADALEAFRFANRSMAMQRVRSIYALKRRRNETVDVATLDVSKNRSWRPFQLAFLLLSVPALADPAHPDRTKPVEAFADLLWFPTGGGKTEAYLGVAAFAMGMRRLKPALGGMDASRGLAVIMRYTLRLLTLQQFQRATTLLCAMDVIRREDEKKWGKEPFSLGLWVGNKVTPGRTEDAHQAIEALRNGDRNRSGISSPAQLTSCPWCGSEISAGRDIQVDRIVGRTSIYCGDTLGQCDFSRARSSTRALPGLPVKVVDEEIYHRPPTMMIATVDKFAMMAWRPEVRTLFGKVDQECERHGLLWPSHDCGTAHRARGTYPAATVKAVRAIRPPDLIIQDEFHLISGPLGTMVGLYETAVDELSCWSIGQTKIRPKVVASTATVRRADDQIRNVFMRRISVFPPSGLDVEDNFFSVQRSITEKPGRRYLGICAPGSSRPAVLIRAYTAFLTAGQALFDKFGPVADPYMTLVGYFNSLRELGGMKRLAEDDVQTRSYRVNMSLVDRPGLAQRGLTPDGVVELTSRVSSHQIPRYLDRMEVPFNGTFDLAKGKWITSKADDATRPIDVVLATNMLSVGVDVNRLGVMVVNGQPKGTAEYIQATSRVGRTPPGLVATVLTWARPRDLSHYETFEHYHATFYQHVEAQSVTPFSPRALDRGLTGAMLSIMRHSYDPFAPNDGAAAMNSPSRTEMLETIKAVTARTWEVTDDPGKKNLAEAELKSRADDWANEAGVGGRTLVYQKYGAGPTAYPLLEAPGIKPWTDWTVPMSMREVEPGVRLIMEDDRSTTDPNWRPRVAQTEEDQQ